MSIAVGRGFEPRSG